MNERYNIEFLLASILLIFTFYHFHKRYRNPNIITLNDVAIWITGIAFGLAPFIFIYSGGSFNEKKNIHVILSYIGIFLFIFALSTVCKLNFVFHRKVFKDENYFASLKQIVFLISPKVIFLFFLFNLFIRIYLGIKYNIFVSGSETEANISNLPYIIIAIRGLTNLLVYTNLIWSITFLFAKKRIFLLPFLIIFIEFLIMFFQGRRPMLFLIFIIGLVFIVLGYRINKKRFLMGSILLFTTVILIFPNFLTFRDYYLSDMNKNNFFDSIIYNMNLTFSTTQDRLKYLENIRTRSYINDWNLQIIEKSGLYHGLNGSVLLLSAYWVIPRFFFPGKYSNVSPEYLINVYSGNYITDSPENLIGYGFADFGLMGSFIYGLLFGLILSLVEGIAIKIKKKLTYTSLILISSFLFVAFSVEQGMISVFSMLRTIIIILFFTSLIKFSVNKIKSIKYLI